MPRPTSASILFVLAHMSTLLASSRSLDCSLVLALVQGASFPLSICIYFSLGSAFTRKKEEKRVTQHLLSSFLQSRSTDSLTTTNRVVYNYTNI
ncbi:uncharacterized protein LOC141533074 isoform X2 [Cotesia typhae]|uniref:uncharacterized protein LOC141533074 isoform X2 n=1 Tax=Cotesia typhae TaxID=2053667 RepID=UPI003D68A12C